VTDEDPVFPVNPRNCVLSHSAGAPHDAVTTLATSRRTREALVLVMNLVAQARMEGAPSVTGDAAAVERRSAMFAPSSLMFDVVGC